MSDQPLTDQQLNEIEAMPRAEDIDVLLAEVRRLRAHVAELETYAPGCFVCMDKPPAGFTCRTCGAPDA